jgi:hypothetical protein
MASMISHPAGNFPGHGLIFQMSHSLCSFLFLFSHFTVHITASQVILLPHFRKAPERIRMR